MHLKKFSSKVLLKTWQTWFCVSKMQSGGNPSTESTVTGLKEIWIQMCLHIPRNMGKHAYVALWVKFSLANSYCSACNVQTSYAVRRTFMFCSRIIVSVFLSRFQLTILILKKFHLRLHCCHLLNGSLVFRPRIRICDMIYSYVWHDSFTCVTWRLTWLVIHGWIMSLIWMSHVAHINEVCPTYEWVMSHIWRNHVQQYGVENGVGTCQIPRLCVYV